MNTMKKIEIPYSAACPNAACSRSNTCARYAMYLKALKAENYFQIMNLASLGVAEEGSLCPYHLTVQKQLWAKGFIRLYASIPHGRVHYFYMYTPYTKRRFYKARKGEVLICPAEQQDLLAAFRQCGADMSLDFDGYEEKEVLLEG